MTQGKVVHAPNRNFSGSACGMTDVNRMNKDQVTCKLCLLKLAKLERLAKKGH